MITDNEKRFTLNDLRNAFIAGEDFQSDFTDVEIGEMKEIENPDFGEYVKEVYDIDL